MALFSLRQCLGTFIRPTILISGLRVQSPTKVCAAFIISKAFRDPSIEKPKPWPYKTKKLTYLHSVFDLMQKRFDENTKIIVVDGNIGAGKTTFAVKLAEEFDMKFIPEPNMDRWYITHYGYDLREIDDLMPPSYKACDLKTFYSNPHHQNVALFQYKMLMARFDDYIDALAHLMNTGQGIVMDRSVYSDFVFMEAMCKAGYISSPAHKLYSDIYRRITKRLLKPHLIVYLDVPVATVLERIKARNDPVEVNSKVLNEKYLQSLEDIYKNEHLKRLKDDCEILIYDWTNYGDVEVVVEDIEAINFNYVKYDTKFKDWCIEDHWEWSYYRRLYTNRKERLHLDARIFRPEVTEVYHPHAEYLEYNEILEKVPGMKYQPGFNADMGDKYLFKLRS